MGVGGIKDRIVTISSYDAVRVTRGLGKGKKKRGEGKKRKKKTVR